jgi:hypothetical protein
MSTSKGEPISCPSATCKTGNSLLGIVDCDGRVSFLHEPVVIDEAFVSIAQKGRAPEKRFRFTTPCIESGCKQWNNRRCSVADEVISVLGTDSPNHNDLPNCGIRQTCRWYKQSGVSACAVCPEVITDTTI